MPYKSKKKHAAYMREYRKRQKQQLKELQEQFPDVYTLLFGKKKKSKR